MPASLLSTRPWSMASQVPRSPQSLPSRDQWGLWGSRDDAESQVLTKMLLWHHGSLWARDHTEQATGFSASKSFSDIALPAFGGSHSHAYSTWGSGSSEPPRPLISGGFCLCWLCSPECSGTFWNTPEHSGKLFLPSSLLHSRQGDISPILS